MPPAHNDAAATWNQRYSGADFIFGTEPNAWLKAQAKIWQPSQRVLCVADGEGRNSVWLARQGLKVDAFDISDVAVAKATRLAAEHQVQVAMSIADCDQFDYGESRYDGVAAIFVQFADPDMRARMFARISQCLKPGGTLILQGYTPKQLEYKTGGPSELSHLYTEELIRQAFPSFEMLALRTYEARLSEGARHSGTSALLGIVGRKPT